MVSQSRILTRSALPSDVLRLANLIHFEAFTHRHLDYRPPLDWVGKEPFLVLEENGRIEAVLACPPDPPFVSWLRLFASSTQISPIEAWESLWYEARRELIEDHKIKYIAAIPLNNWFETFLKQSQFVPTHSIVMLKRDIPGDRIEQPNSIVRIRAMKPEDIEDVLGIDREAFEPIWANSAEYLDAAYRLAFSALVAEADNHIIGYQITTPSAIGGHLARLAVKPNYHGLGIGRNLLSNLIQQLNRRGARVLTVNTQKDNLASLRLYQQMGFSLTGEEYPIYQLSPS